MATDRQRLAVALDDYFAQTHTPRPTAEPFTTSLLEAIQTYLEPVHGLVVTTEQVRSALVGSLPPVRRRDEVAVAIPSSLEGVQLSDFEQMSLERAVDAEIDRVIDSIEEQIALALRPPFSALLRMSDPASGEFCLDVPVRYRASVDRALCAELSTLWARSLAERNHRRPYLSASFRHNLHPSLQRPPSHFATVFYFYFIRDPRDEHYGTDTNV